MNIRVENFKNLLYNNNLMAADMAEE